MTDLVIGLGEIGGSWADLISAKREVLRKDKEPLERGKLPEIDVMHVCFPYSGEFDSAVRDYEEVYKPNLTMIHTTVVPGTTAALSRYLLGFVAYSPIRGRHEEMLTDLRHYTKFVAAPNLDALEVAQKYLTGLDLFPVRTYSSCTSLELAKLIETTYSGLLIAWAQEMARYCERVNADYYEVLRFIQEVEYLPRFTFHPGYIGGHCIIQNLNLLEQVRPTTFTCAIRCSNDACRVEQKRDPTRYRPEVLKWQLV